MSFQELVSGQPSRTDSLRIEERSKGNKVLGGSPYTFVLMDPAKQDEFRTIRRKMVGISDGLQFYISDRYAVGGWMGMSPCLMAGPYIWASTPGLNASHGYLINIRTGQHGILNKKLLQDLIKNHANLVNEYKNEEIMDHISAILDKLNTLEGK